MGGRARDIGARMCAGHSATTLAHIGEFEPVSVSEEKLDMFVNPLVVHVRAVGGPIGPFGGCMRAADRERVREEWLRAHLSKTQTTVSFVPDSASARR